jgi:hypothetical protein
MNVAALRLLAKGAGLVPPKEEPHTVGGSLDHLIGTWSQRQAEEFLDSIRSCEQIDGDFWR